MLMDEIRVRLRNLARRSTGIDTTLLLLHSLARLLLPSCFNLALLLTVCLLDV